MPDFRKMARAAARKYGIDEDLFEAQINQESGFDEDVIYGRRVSSAGAQGIAQIMPGTAKGWKVNPLNPREALDAAARNMAVYIKTYGGWEPALRAYNAGPGNVKKSHEFAETNNYVKSIMKGRTPKPSTGGVRTASPGPTTSGTSAPATSSNPSPLFSVLQGMQQPEETTAPDLGMTVAALKRIQGIGSTPTATATPTPAPTGTPGSSTPTGGGRLPGLKGLGAGIEELFYDPLGGWDKGKNIGAIGGHSDHVHVASRGRKTAVALAKLAKEMGLHVSEIDPFDKVDPVHTQGSWHYSGKAADVSGPAKRMAEYTRRLQKLYGLK